MSWQKGKTQGSVKNKYMLSQNQPVQCMYYEKDFLFSQTLKKKRLPKIAKDMNNSSMTFICVI